MHSRTRLYVISENPATRITPSNLTELPHHVAQKIMLLHRYVHFPRWRLQFIVTDDLDVFVRADATAGTSPRPIYAGRFDSPIKIVHLMTNLSMCVRVNISHRESVFATCDQVLKIGDLFEITIIDPAHREEIAQMFSQCARNCIGMTMQRISFPV